MKRLPLLTLTFALAALVGGCSRVSSNNAPASPQQVKAAQREQASDRELLDEIPPPAKSRYMAIHTKASWDNPFLVVASKTVSLRVMNPEPPRSSLLPGRMMQPVSARKNLLELRLSNLPEALASIPENDWPYGRVIAVEEDPSEVRANRVQVRRNVEATMQILNNLGVVAYEWPGGGNVKSKTVLRGRRCSPHGPSVKILACRTAFVCAAHFCSRGSQARRSYCRR